MIDTHIYLGRWPFRRLPLDRPDRLVMRLRDQGVAEAWAGSFDALLHEDVEGVNLRLAEDCKRHGDGLLRPFGTANPRLPDWQEDLRRCHEAHGMPGIRVHPNYHGYTLDDPAFAELLADAERRGLLVQIAAQLEDARTQYALLQAPPVALAPLADLRARFPNLKLMVLNAPGISAGDPIRPIVSGAGADILVEIAMLEGAAGLERLIPKVGLDRIAFGSMAPLFVFESARLKLKESALPLEQQEAILRSNPRRLLAPAAKP